MSSVVKKSTHFVPKIRKKPLKRKVDKSATPAAQLTPPATQETSQAAATQQGEKVPETSKDAASIETPASTQAPASVPATSTSTSSHSVPIPNSTTEPLSSFNFKVKEAARASEDVDPIDSSKKPELIPKPASDPKSDSNESQNENSDSDDDLFKEQAPPRKSSIQQRRLSGITPILNRNRSGSVSFSNHTGGEANVSGAAEPAKIVIPIGKAKRRRSSAQNRGAVKRASIIKPSAEITPKEPSPVAEEASESATTSTSDFISKYGDREFVVGIDAKTSKLTKFRIRPPTGKNDPDESTEIETTKLAPEELVTRITSTSQIPRIIKPEEEALYRDIGLNFNEMTMADLCKPTLPIGKVSSNYESVVAAQAKINERKRKRRQDRDVARLERISLEELAIRNGDIEETDEDRKKKQNELLNTDQEVTSSGFQLTMVDGKIGVNADSAVVSRHRNVDNSKLVREESNPFENPITSSTYSKRKHTDRWTQDEVKQFYTALSTFGTDFLLISQLFPYRTRKQIKSKFNLEEKNYPEIIELALRRKLPADFEQYCQDSKHNIKSLEYYNEELRQIRINHEKEMVELAEKQEASKKLDAEESRRRELELRTGSRFKTRKEMIADLRKNQSVVGSLEKKPTEESVEPSHA